MIWLLNDAIANLLLALIIWAIIIRFVVKKRWLTLASLGWFLAIWFVITAADAIMEVQNRRLVSMAVQTERLFGSQIAPKAFADENTANVKSSGLAANMPELRSMIRDVISGGVVDRQIHNRFWSLIPLSLVSTPIERRDLINTFSKGIIFQKNFWECVLLSAQMHQVVKTKAYEAALRQLDPTYQDESEAMLRAAASGTPFVSSNGQTVILNEVNARLVLSKLDAASARLQVLFNPAWRNTR